MSKREQIVQLHQQGMTYGQISQRLGVSRGTVGGHLARWREENDILPDRIPGERWTVDQDDELAKLHLASVKNAEVAKILGRTVNAIEKRLTILRDCGALRRTCEPARAPDQLGYAARQRRDDAKFLHALAHAFIRGDHLPAERRMAA